MTPRTRRLVLVLATSLGVALGLPVPAQASYPAKNTTYRADVIGEDGLAARIRIVIGADKKKVAKVSVRAECADGTSVRMVRRDVEIDPAGGFAVERLTKKGKMLYSIGGAWESRDAAYGEVDLLRCPPGGFGYLAER